jgi:hypothetical protein
MKSPVITASLVFERDKSGFAWCSQQLQHGGQTTLQVMILLLDTSVQFDAAMHAVEAN